MKESIAMIESGTKTNLIFNTKIEIVNYKNVYIHTYIQNSHWISVKSLYPTHSHMLHSCTVLTDLSMLPGLVLVQSPHL